MVIRNLSSVFSVNRPLTKNKKNLPFSRSKPCGRHTSCLQWHRLEPLERRVLFSITPELPGLLPQLDCHELDDVITITADHIGNSDDILREAVDVEGDHVDVSASGEMSTVDPSGQVPYGATYQDPSEFMIGDVLVTVVLLESNGIVDANTEDWTSSQITQVKDEILEGLTWWEDTFDAQNSLHDLNFFIDFTYADTPLQSDYEAISRPSTEQGYWINSFLNEVGYNGPGSVFNDLDQWNHDQRQTHSTDWAYTLFVVNSSNDQDGKFSDGSFAYAYLGGPFAVMTTDNSNWGIDQMGQVLAHETGHIFYGLDEYAGGDSYTDQSGYYGTQALNAFDGHPDPSTRTASILAEPSLQAIAYTDHTSAVSTLEMLGWKDSDGDGIFDVLDVPLSLTGSGEYNVDSGRYEFAGHSVVGTLDNLNTRGMRHDITTNTVDRLQYRLDNGDWLHGGLYGGFDVDVNHDVLVTEAGVHTIDFRTVFDDTNLTSNIWSDTFTIADQSPGITVTPVSGLTTGESGDSATFRVMLTSQPTADVTINVYSDNSAEGMASTSSLVFTDSNWNVEQTVTVTGVDDATDDGDTSYTIILDAAYSTDPGYDGIDPDNVTVVNTDNDDAPAGVQVTPTTGLAVSESGTTAEFSITLLSKPTDTVTIPLSSDDVSEGTLSVSSLTFTAENWHVPQSVIVTGVDDGDRDGNVIFMVSTEQAQSNDGRYHGLDAEDVSVTNQDNDKKGGGNTGGGGGNTNGGGKGGGKKNTAPSIDSPMLTTSADSSELSETNHAWLPTISLWSPPIQTPSQRPTWSLTQVDLTSTTSVHSQTRPALSFLETTEDEREGILPLPWAMASDEFQLQPIIEE